MMTQLEGQTRMDSGSTGVTLKAGGKELHMTEEQWDRGTKAYLDEHRTSPAATDAPPSWDELSTAFQTVDRLRSRVKLTKDQIKDLQADLGLVELADELKELKVQLVEAEGVRDELGRCMRASRVDTRSGEVVP